MHPEFIEIGLPEDKVIEEASEVIKAICKAKRFGLENFNPYDPEKITNKQKILEEMDDLSHAIDTYKLELKEWSYDNEY